MNVSIATYHQLLMLRRDAVQQSASLLSEASRLIIVCHANPDGDAVGALLGMGMLLEQAYPHATVYHLCHDPVPPMLAFLPRSGSVHHALTLQLGDAVVVVDSAEPKLTQFHETHPEIFNRSVPCINIDHHPSNLNFGTVNLVDPEAASACEIVAEFASVLGWRLTPDIATCLLTGIYTDTGGLLHSNVTAQVYRTVAELLRAGARQRDIVKSVFRTAKLSTLKLWGRVLEKISLTREGGAVSAVTKGDFAATGADASDLTGAIDYLNAVPGMRFSMILSERDGKVKGSIRTLRDDVDVATMAGKFDGGGHRKAAGFSLPGKLQPEVRWTVVKDAGGAAAVD